MKKQFLFHLLMCMPCILFAKEGGEEIEPLPVGNFSVPSSTQIGPLVSFGQLLVEKGVLFPELPGTYTRSHKGYFNEIEPDIIYGITEDCAIAFSIPFTPRSKLESSHSSGLEDMSLALEYAFYERCRKDSNIEATIIGSVQFPTGSSSKEPPTGTGSWGYFLGTTLSYLSPNWYAFISPGANLTTSHHGTKIGNSYLYQWGFARYIKQLSPRGWVFNFMVEFDGTYAEKDRKHGSIDHDSGGNTILVTPSISLASKIWSLQWGIGFPILHQLNGDQDKTLYSIAYNVGLAIQF